MKPPVANDGTKCKELSKRRVLYFFISDQRTHFFYLKLGPYSKILSLPMRRLMPST